MSWKITEPDSAWDMTQQTEKIVHKTHCLAEEQKRPSIVINNLDRADLIVVGQQADAVRPEQAARDCEAADHQPQQDPRPGRPGGQSGRIRPTRSVDDGGGSLQPQGVRGGPPGPHDVSAEGGGSVSVLVSLRRALGSPGGQS